ncbi:MAG TPA: hypothetical protein VFH99_00330 [Candidatus Saccharimonadales bacterium]|nr:hypothetical protein [Candidatus Saccharimonadales bacterium]
MISNQFGNFDSIDFYKVRPEPVATEDGVEWQIGTLMPVTLPSGTMPEAGEPLSARVHTSKPDMGTVRVVGAVGETEIYEKEIGTSGLKGFFAERRIRLAERRAVHRVSCAINTAYANDPF